MTDAVKINDHDVLEQRLEALEICVSQLKDGGLSVYSKSEPLFCFDCVDEREAFSVVESTLKSYVKTFFHVENVKVTAVKEQRPEVKAGPELRVVEATPFGRIRPRFSNFSGEPALAVG